MGHNEVGKVKTLTTITKGWLRLRLFNPGHKTARALLVRPFTPLIMKITISSIVIGLKKTPFFLLIHLPSCYQTVCYWTVQKANHIQSCKA